LCRHFGADAVIVVGSQAILATWPDAPIVLRSSGEIDAYPANAKDWEVHCRPRGEGAGSRVCCRIGLSVPTAGGSRTEQTECPSALIRGGAALVSAR
jgi:hypothetical protein